MSELSPGLQQKKDWKLTPGAFHRLLNWLDEGTDSGGLRYEEMRRRLVAYFYRKNCPMPDELADQTLNRVARRLEEVNAIEIEAPAKYCYIVARFVFLESLREQKNFHLLDEVRQLPRETISVSPGRDEDKMVQETILDCLEKCTRALAQDKRDLILRYYIGKERTKIENRRVMAHDLGISVNALSIRACRIRDKLAACVRQCMGAA